MTTATMSAEDAAATKLQAHYKGHSARKQVDEMRQTAADEAAYEKSNRERAFRMRQREEQKAMLLDLPAGEVEDWQTQQEHVAAITVQSNFRRHKAKREVEVAREEARDRPPRSSEPELGASASASRAALADDGSDDPSFDPPPATPLRPPRPMDQIVAGLKADHSRREVGAPETTMESYVEGRRRSDALLATYREAAGERAANEARRRAARRRAEKEYVTQRSLAHASLAELPSDADPGDFPDPPGADPRAVKATHKELMDAAQAERKWWKPLVKLNREQRVLDQRDAEEKQRASAGAGAGGGPNGGGGWATGSPGGRRARERRSARGRRRRRPLERRILRRLLRGRVRDVLIATTRSARARIVRAW